MKLLATFTLMLGFSAAAFAQGPTGTLRCASGNQTFSVHASRDPGSKVVTTLKCGDKVMVIDQQFGSPHVRTADGADGYIIGLNIGQWSLEVEPQTARLPGLPLVDAPAPKPPAQEFRRFEAGLTLPTFVRQGNNNSLGASATFAMNLTPIVAATADVNVERIIEPNTDNFRAWTAHVGLRANIVRAEHVTLFVKSTPGFWHALDNNATTKSGFSFRTGGGVDYNASEWFRWRVVEANYSLLALDESWANGVRFGTGFAVRFGGAEPQ